MTIRKVYLVQPGRDGKFLGKATMAPYTLMRLASLVPDSLDVEIIDEDVKPVPFDKLGPGDLVGVTAKTLQIERAQWIAERAQAQRRDGGHRRHPRDPQPGRGQPVGRQHCRGRGLPHVAADDQRLRPRRLAARLCGHRMGEPRQPAADLRSSSCNRWTKAAITGRLTWRSPVAARAIAHSAQRSASQGG